MKINASYRIPLIVALILHAGLLIGFTVNTVHSNYRWQTQKQSKPIVQAKTIDQKHLASEIKQIKWERTKRQRQEIKHLRDIEHKTLLARQRRTREERRIAMAERKQAELQKKQKLAEKKAQKLRQQLKQMHLKKLTEQQQALQEKLLQQQLQKEQVEIVKRQQQLKQQHMAKVKGLLDKYRAEILQVIQTNWHPLEKNPKLYCQLLVHVAPKGVVTAVDIIRPSGDATLDRTARTAVLKSSPLPVPQDPALFDEFRELRIKMTPQEIKGLS